MFIEIALFLVLVYAIATRLGPGAWLWHFVVHDEVLFYFFFIFLTFCYAFGCASL